MIREPRKGLHEGDTGAGDFIAVVRMAMLAGLPYTAVRDAIIPHPTLPKGLIQIFGKVPLISAHVAKGYIG